MSSAADIVDKVLEGPIVTSFTNIGYAARKRLDDWRELDSYDLSGRVIAITGPTSGLGMAAAEQLASMNASLILVARNEEKVASLRHRLMDQTGNETISTALADLGDLNTVRSAAKEIAAQHDRLDVLIHNAGALSNEKTMTESGLELTTAVHVVGPFLMTGLLLDALAATPGSRVLTMSSGGMYTAGLTVDNLVMSDENYGGSEQYARAKRAQVTLNEMWAERAGDRGITFHALHPGWADTPGVEASLPTFRKIVGPFLRDPLQGADTLVWLSADDGEPLEVNGGFWLDRRIRPIHKIASTRRTDTPQRRERLWEWVAERAGWDLG